jgi:hypothetical protein
VADFFLRKLASFIAHTSLANVVSLNQKKRTVVTGGTSGHISVGQPFGMSSDKERVVVTIAAKQMRYVSYINVPKSNYMTKRCMQTSVADE